MFYHQEAFSAAKQSFTNFKSRVRSNLVTSHLGPETLEEAVQNYINRNPDLYDLPGLVSVSATNIFLWIILCAIIGMLVIFQR